MLSKSLLMAKSKPKSKARGQLLSTVVAAADWHNRYHQPSCDLVALQCLFLSGGSNPTHWHRCEVVSVRCTAPDGINKRGVALGVE